MNLITAWHDEHRYFMRLLELLQREIDRFHTGERPNYELMLDVITYLRRFSDRIHHPREDAAFACLARRFPEMQLPLARLQQEHRVIAHAGEKLLQHLNAILSGAMIARAEVEAAASTYLVYYRNHIATEESSIMNRASALDAEDWEAVRRGAPDEDFRQFRRQIALDA
jgi:hemerythrin-like domain-containing protein